MVDINPHRQGYYMTGAAQEIVALQAVTKIQPNAVIVMNPVYRDEIGRDLESMGVTAAVYSL